jgi:phage gp29-like protein
MAKKKIDTDQQPTTTHTPTMAPKVVRKTIPQTRKDIADWKWAWRLATNPQEPKQYLLQDVYNDITNDALLTSQLNNRAEQSVSAPFEMVTPEGTVDKKATEILRAIAILPDIIKFIWESEWYGCSVIELSEKNGIKKVDLINRRNIVADFGRFYPDTSLNTYIEYRNANEFGKWILEFNSDNIGALNKLVPHILFKKFAQSCWSELCEIFGIPPRYLKTNTNDPAMLNRAEEMMQEVGAAAWFIIDTTEEFEFAKGVSTNGDVYSNLITLCNNEICMPVSGAIIGQDTKNGNESKEKVSISILDRLVEADKRMIEGYMNTIVIPALYRIGWIPSTTSRFKYSAIEDTDRLWTITKEILPHKNVDNDFIEEKFGVKVTDKIPGADFQ